MSDQSLPEYCRPIAPGERFSFACHPGVPCFTECCRELDLALSPYDVLRLRGHLGLGSGQFLHEYVIVEWEEGQVFPTCYLTMVDDGRASCVFVGPQGCRVYKDRPGSCRAYPLGRGMARKADGTSEQSLVLLREPHCQGFGQTSVQSGAEYLNAQELEPYNRFNDALLSLYQHAHVRSGNFRPGRTQLDQYMLALFDLDGFRLEMNSNRIALNQPLTPARLRGLTGDDEELLLLGIRWLIQEFFGE